MMQDIIIGHTAFSDLGEAKRRPHSWCYPGWISI